MSNAGPKLMMAAAGQGGGLVSVENSAVYNSSAAQYLVRTFGTPTDQDVWTISMWLNMKLLGDGVNNYGIFGGAANNSDFCYYQPATNKILFSFSGAAGGTIPNVLRDALGWTHFVMKMSGTSITAYYNGVQVFTDTMTVNDWNSAVACEIGTYNSAVAGARASMYMAETVFIDGLALEPTSFGEYDTTGLYWTPKSSTAIKALTFGNNGFYLDNTTNPQTDASGRDNHFTNTNSVTTTDLMSPTKLPRLLWNPLSPAFAATLSEGNTKTASSGVHQGAWANTNFPKTGKWQTEVLVTLSGASAIASFAIMKNLSAESLNQYIGTNSQAYGFYAYPSNQSFYSATSELFTTGAVSRGTYKYQICWDASAGDGTADVYFGIDNTFYDNDGSTDGNPATGANPTIENLDISTSEWSLLGVPYDAGTLQTADEADWEYTIQTGYTALTLTNIAEATTRTGSDPYEHWANCLWTGTGGALDITIANETPNGSSFDPVGVWVKNRSTTDSHAAHNHLSDSTSYWQPDVTTSALQTNANSITSMTTGKFVLGTGAGGWNDNTETFVGWAMGGGGRPTTDNVAGATPTSGSVYKNGVINTDTLTGSIKPTRLSIDTVSGITVGQFTGTAANATVDHGQDIAPGAVFFKSGANSQNTLYHDAEGGGTAIFIDNNTEATAVGYFNNTAPSSTLLSVGTSSYTNPSSTDCLFVSFSPSVYVAINIYEGNGVANGAYVPAINSEGIPLMPIWTYTNSIDAGTGHYIHDVARDISNPLNTYLDFATNGQDTDTTFADYVSGGTKLRAATAGFNAANTFLQIVVGIPIIDVDGRILAGR